MLLFLFVCVILKLCYSSYGTCSTGGTWAPSSGTPGNSEGNVIALCWLYWSGDLADLLYPDPVFRVEPISVTVFSS